MFKHAAKIDLIEASIFHSLQQVGTQFELPRPPLRPLMCAQGSSEPSTRLVLVLPTVCSGSMHQSGYLSDAVGSRGC